MVLLTGRGAYLVSGAEVVDGRIVRITTVVNPDKLTAARPRPDHHWNSRSRIPTTVRLRMLRVSNDS